jgi:hypothetical protein
MIEVDMYVGFFFFFFGLLIIGQYQDVGINVVGKRFKVLLFISFLKIYVVTNLLVESLTRKTDLFI